MKTIKRTGINGKTITLYIPENNDDLKQIETMDKAGLIDTNVGFADSRNQTLSKHSRVVSRTRTGCKPKTPQPA